MDDALEAVVPCGGDKDVVDQLMPATDDGRRGSFKVDGIGPVTNRDRDDEGRRSLMLRRSSGEFVVATATVATPLRLAAAAIAALSSARARAVRALSVALYIR